MLCLNRMIASVNIGIARQKFKPVKQSNLSKSVSLLVLMTKIETDGLNAQQEEDEEDVLADCHED